MGIRKGYDTDRCPACDTRLVVKHSRKNGKYHYCTYCDNILVGRKSETITRNNLSKHDVESSDNFKMRKKEMRMR